MNNGGLEPRKRRALDGKVWWCAFDTYNMKWSAINIIGKYVTKSACQDAINRYWKIIIGEK